MTASTLCLDAVWMIKTVLAAIVTKNFTDVIEVVFEGIEVRTAMEAKEGLLLEEEETVQPSTSTLSKTMKRKQAPSTDVPQRKVSRKAVPICPLDKASVINPSEKHRKCYLHAGVDNCFTSSCQSSSVSQKVGYCCQYSAITEG